MILLLLLLAPLVSAAEVPFYNREVSDQRDVGAVNENFRATADAIRKTDLTNGGTIDGTLTVSGAATMSSITWPDGTVQRSSPSASGIWRSSSTDIPIAAVDQRTLIVAQATITFTTVASNAIWICAIGSTDDATNQNIKWTVLLDGAHPSGYSATEGLWGGGNKSDAGGYLSSISGCIELRSAPSAGSHTWGFSMASASNDVTIGATGHKPRFGVFQSQ